MNQTHMCTREKWQSIRPDSSERYPRVNRFNLHSSRKCTLARRRFNTVKLLPAICLLPLVFAIPLAFASPGWGWTINYQLDTPQYAPGSSGKVSVSLVNTGDVQLEIREVGIQFDWQPSDRWWSQPTNVRLGPGQQANLGSVSFEVPPGVSEGIHRFRLGVAQRHLATYYDPYTGIIYTQWVDDGVQFAGDYDEIKIEQLKAALTYVSVTGLPPLGRPIYVGETSATIAVISNTGNAKARAVRLVLEDLSPPTGLVVASSDPPKDIDPLGTAQWKIEVRGERPGKYAGMLRVYAENERILEQAWELEVLAPEIIIARKEFSAQEGQIYAGDTIIVTYTLRNTSPVDVNQPAIDVETSEGLSVVEVPSISEIRSQSDVKVAIKLRAEKPGAASVHVAISAYGIVVQEDQFNLNISERPVWTEQWFVAGVGLGVALLVVVIALTRRRRPKTPGIVLPQQRLSAEPSTSCPRCGKPLTFVQAYSRWYCTKCKEYV